MTEQASAQPRYRFDFTQAVFQKGSALNKAPAISPAALVKSIKMPMKKAPCRLTHSTVRTGSQKSALALPCSADRSTCAKISTNSQEIRWGRASQCRPDPHMANAVKARARMSRSEYRRISRKSNAETEHKMTTDPKTTPPRPQKW